MSRRVRLPLLAATLLSVLVACQPAESGDEAASASDSMAADASTAPPAVEVTAADFSFTGPPTLPSGWTTFRFTNGGEQTHFMVLWHLPEGKTFDDYARDVGAAFAATVPRYRAGETDRNEFLAELGGALPEWFLTSVDGWGGVGFTAPGHTAEATVRLEPGQYVMECYAQTPEGEFHGDKGMLRPLIVTEADNGATEPSGDTEVTLSNYRIDAPDALTPGEHTVRVTVTENPEGLLGHDVHLARLQTDDDLAAAVAWVDWVDSMRSPAPVEFLGGVDEMPAGHSGYFHVNLEPGRYAWISEGYAAQGMVKEFTVGDSQGMATEGS